MTNQTIEDFRSASKRTMKSLGDSKLDLCHCILGMMSELEEYIEAVDKEDVTNISEEVVDIFFYVVNYMTFRDVQVSFNYEHKDKLNSLILYNLLVLEISSLSDLVKKHVAYNKEIDKEKEKLIIFRICITLQELCISHDIDIEKSMQNNVDKLLVRFPLETGYTDDNAINRKLDLERKMLEQ